MPCAQELELTAAQLAKGDPIPLKLVKFNNVDVLSGGCCTGGARRHQSIYTLRGRCYIYQSLAAVVLLCKLVSSQSSMCGRVGAGRRTGQASTHCFQRLPWSVRLSLPKLLVWGTPRRRH